MELPDGWDEPGFKWPRGRALMFRVDIGARSPDEVAQMGVAVKDFVSIPKKFRRLANDFANCRAFDDRVGDASLISAAWALGRIGSPEAIARLKHRYESEEDATVRSEISAALEPFGGDAR